LADEKNVKTISTGIDEMPVKVQLEDYDVFMVKGTGSVTNKSSLLSFFEWLQNKLSSKFSEKLDVNLKGSARGLAELDDTGKVPSTQLPSYVDNVLNGYLFEDSFFEDEEHTTELRPESGKIYINLEQDQNENKTYRWAGTTYVVISDTITLGETSSTAYRGDRGKIAYEHTLLSNGSNPHRTTKADVGLELVENIATEDALISYEEPADPVEGEQEAVPETGSNLKAIVGWMMKKIKHVTATINSLSNRLQDLNGTKADYAVITQANISKNGIFFGEGITNGAAGSGIELIVSCSNTDKTMIMQQSTVMSGSNAGKIFVRRYISGAWGSWSIV
jgi:hypothetical protein